MTSNSLTENEEHDIPSQILKIIFGLDICYPMIPNYSGQLAALIVYIIPPEQICIVTKFYQHADVVKHTGAIQYSFLPPANS